MIGIAGKRMNGISTRSIMRLRSSPVIVSVDLPDLVARRDFLARDYAVHQHVRHAVDGDDDDHARDDRIEVAGRQHDVQQIRFLADLEGELEAAGVGAARDLHGVERIDHLLRRRYRHAGPISSDRWMPRPASAHFLASGLRCKSWFALHLDGLPFLRPFSFVTALDDAASGFFNHKLLDLAFGAVEHLAHSFDAVGGLSLRRDITVGRELVVLLQQPLLETLLEIRVLARARIDLR